ncbi:MAG: CDP-diacylglycerol--serine O-phosphatidyltransferase [Frankiales bacterium]|nr:CDP-diacylglycerol--serine O-phosphatidyltransferase [Frankiales bacterium]
MREHLVPANLVTSASLSAGVVALLLRPDQVGLATLLVVVAGVLDGCDGVLARRRGGDHRFGAQLDSLTDLLCFCVVPAVVLARAVDADWPVAGRVVAVAFALGGAWRLARFPLVKESGHFVGLPTPSAGGLVMLLTLLAPAPVALVGALVLAWLMTSTLRFPTVVSAAVAVRPGRRDAGERRRARFPRPSRPRVLGRTRRIGPKRARPSRRRRVLRALQRR